MVKCAITGKKIETTFLDKILGTYVKDENGKRHPYLKGSTERIQDERRNFKACLGH